MSLRKLHCRIGSHDDGAEIIHFHINRQVD
jgi:hypothetical protein